MSQPTLLRLKRKAKRLGITQAQIAEAAGVKVTLVCHLFAGRAKSQNVLRTARRLVAEAAAGQGNGEGTKTIERVTA